MNEKQESKSIFKKIAIAKNEDVEFNRELADRDDLKAQQRAAEADNRAQK